MTLASPSRRRGRHLTASLLPAGLLLLGLALPAPVPAAEGGSSHYVQGTQGDFAMALIGPPGWYFRNDLAFMDGDIGPVTRGRYELERYEQEVLANTFKLIHLSKGGLFGGRLGVALALPYALDVDAAGTLSSPAGLTLSGSGSGLADPALTVFLNWNPEGHFSYSAGLTTYSDLGDYDPDRILQYGRNYWSFDLTGSLTWMVPEKGREFSIAGGLMFNTENEATDYGTGNEFHVDVMLAQHFSPKFGLGLAGYFYHQFTDDDGALVGMLPVGSGGFRGEGAGLGPALKYTARMGDTDVTFIGKWIKDVHSQNRLDNSNFMLSVAARF